MRVEIVVERRNLVAKLEHFKSQGEPENGPRVSWLRSQINQIDAKMLAEETERLKADGFKFEVIA